MIVREGCLEIVYFCTILLWAVLLRNAESELDWLNGKERKGRHWMSNIEGKKGEVKDDSKEQH